LIGYVCEQYNSPPDFFLDVINGDSTAIQSQQGLYGLSHVNALANIQVAYRIGLVGLQCTIPIEVVVQ